MSTKTFNLKLGEGVSGKIQEEPKYELRVATLCFCTTAKLNLFLFSSYFLLFITFSPLLTGFSHSFLAAVTNYQTERLK